MLPQVWPAILTLGWILFATAAGEGVMALVALAAADGMATEFAVTAAVTAAVAGACVLTTKGRPFDLRFRDAALLTVLSWFLVPAFAALPLIPAPAALSFVDAYFEMASGITTTGSTVMAGLDTMPASILLWRSTVQWLGGVGIIGLAIIILPFLKIGGMQLFRLESSDRSENLLPNVRGVAKAVGNVYLALTLACFLTYWGLGMAPFDALNHAFTTLPTAGFSTHDASFGYFNSPALEWAGVVFMAAGAFPFLAYIRLVRPGSLRERVDRQAVMLVVILALATLAFAAWMVLAKGYDIGTALTKSAFNVTSVVTTSGFVSFDYTSLGAFAGMLFFLLSFVGGCTGSTAGALKVFRLEVMAKIAVQHIHRAGRPHVVAPIRYGARVLSDDQVASVGAFVFLYFAAFAVISVMLSALGLDMEVALSSTAQALGNVGPGIGPIIGPAGNFSSLPDAAKVILSFAMILGRLEILGVLILFMPSFYR
ncbi:MAG: TrkH family potassium uptake protein [Bauldia sp.]